MMLEQYECPECHKNIEIDDQCEDQYMTCPHCNFKLRSPVAPMFIKDTIIGDYKIIKRIGIGGMGEVYLAEQQSMLRPVALKVLQDSLVEDASYLERFYREVRTLAQIEHPNIVKAIETGYVEEGRISYFSMRFIEGEDLKQRLDSEGKLPEVDALNIIMHVALALQHVWDKYQLIHRDIKPANIIVTSDGEVKLMDLGISKSMNKNSPVDLTIAGMMVGSPYYVSPEQARAEKNLDFRADMYSLGASFFHMITGTLPFDSDNAMAIIASHIKDPVPDPKKILHTLSTSSSNIIYKMMGKTKEDRYSSWDDALDDIEDAINELTKESPGKATSLQPAVNLRNTQISSLSKAPSKDLNEKNKIMAKSINQTKNMKVLDVMKNGPLGKVFGNLYIRFVFLVLLLVLTFIGFFSVIKNSIREEKENRASRYMSKAQDYLLVMPQTKSGFNEAYTRLMRVKKVGETKFSFLADQEIKELQNKLIVHRNKNVKELAHRELLNLKNRSHKFEMDKKYKKALNIWMRYRKNGVYAKYLRREINLAIKFLINKKDEVSSDNGGID